MPTVEGLQIRAHELDSELKDADFGVSKAARFTPL
jgi:hypothetical protein